LFSVSNIYQKVRKWHSKAWHFFSKGRKKFTQMPYLIIPESFSVNVKTKDVVSLKLIRFGPTLMHPSG
jgi:hypothetical protein